MARLIQINGGSRGDHPGSHHQVTGRDTLKRRRDSGMVTAELAVGFLSVAVVLGIMIFAIGVGITHTRAQEAARAGARAAARGDSAAEVRSVARSAMPGAHVSVKRGSERVEVRVSTQVQVPFTGIGTVNVSSTSRAEREPL